jgi:hypothetical protein
VAEGGEKKYIHTNLIKPTGWWENTGIAVLPGEVALEQIGDNAYDSYLLLGDGLPAGSSHDRMRFGAKNIPANDGKTVQTHITELKNQISTHEASTTAHSSTATPTANRIAMYGAEKGLKSDKVPSATNDVIRKAELDTEKTARETVDDGLQNQINEHDGLIDTLVDISGDYLREWDVNYDDTAGDIFTGNKFELICQVEYEDGYVGEREFRETDHLGFSDYTTTDKWKELYALVLSSAGERLRVMDGGGIEGFPLNRIVDREWGIAEMREVDAAGAGGACDCFAGAEWEDA